MAIYAVIKTGGKQYRVAPGDVVKVERLAVVPGATVEISEVYLLANDQTITTGNPTIANARVVAEVIEEGRDKKIVVFKKKRRKGYQRTIGHRQYFTTLRINEIAVGDNVYKAAATVARADAPKAIKAAPAPPRSTKHDHTPPPVTKSVQAPKAQLPKEAAPIKPDARDRDAVVASTGVPDKSPVKPPEPMIAAPETISPAAPPSATPTEAPRLTKAAPPVAGTDPARITDTASAPAPSAREEPLRPETPPVRQPEATAAPAPDKRWYWLAAGLVILLLAGIGFLLSGDRGQGMPEDAVPVTAQPEEAAPSKPKPKEVKIKKPTAGAAPSAPVQPPD